MGPKEHLSVINGYSPLCLLKKGQGITGNWKLLLGVGGRGWKSYFFQALEKMELMESSFAQAVNIPNQPQGCSEINYWGYLQKTRTEIRCRVGKREEMKASPSGSTRERLLEIL